MTTSDLEILSWVADDFEALHTIRDDIGRELRRAVTDEELYSSLLRLHGAGLVDAYRFNPMSCAYEPVGEPSAVAPKDLWFRASATGRAKLNDAT